MSKGSTRWRFQAKQDIDRRQVVVPSYDISRGLSRERSNGLSENQHLGAQRCEQMDRGKLERNRWINLPRTWRGLSRLGCFLVLCPTEGSQSHLYPSIYPSIHPSIYVGTSEKRAVHVRLCFTPSPFDNISFWHVSMQQKRHLAWCWYRRYRYTSRYWRLDRCCIRYLWYSDKRSADDSQTNLGLQWLEFRISLLHAYCNVAGICSVLQTWTQLLLVCGLLVCELAVYSLIVSCYIYVLAPFWDVLCETADVSHCCGVLCSTSITYSSLEKPLWYHSIVFYTC